MSCTGPLHIDRSDQLPGNYLHIHSTKWLANKFTALANMEEEQGRLVAFVLFLYGTSMQSSPHHFEVYSVQQNPHIPTASVTSRESWNVAFILEYCMPRIKLKYCGRTRVNIKMNIAVFDSVLDQTLTALPHGKSPSLSRISGMLTLRFHAYPGDIFLDLCLPVLVLVPKVLLNYLLRLMTFSWAHPLLWFFFPSVNWQFSYDPYVLLNSSHLRPFVEDPGFSAGWGSCWSKQAALGASLRTYLASPKWLIPQSCS